MNIVVLDGYTLNPGDLSWRELENLGKTTVYDRTSDDLIVDRAKEAEIILTNITILSKKRLKQLPKLKYIGVLATGFDVIDIQMAKKQGIIVTNIPTYGTDSVAQHVFALVLELCQHVGHHSDSVKKGEWSSSADWCYWHKPIMELAGKTMGIIGFGRIGRATADLALAFGMKILFYDPSAKSQSSNEKVYCELNELLQKSDIVSLHCPLTPKNEELINQKRLSLMKPSAFLINTSRGRLIKDADLANALNEGIIGGAGLDVLSVEPPSPNNPLLTARNCIVTPHIAWASNEARSRMLDIAVENVKQFVAEKPCNVVNG